MVWIRTPPSPSTAGDWVARNSGELLPLNEHVVTDDELLSMRLAASRALPPHEAVEVLLPAQGDIHQVTNALTDKSSISIHVYGGNIGAVRRHTFDVETGKPNLFVSGYTNQIVPNLWDRSAEVRASN